MRGIWITALLCLAPSLHAGTWTVDDNGPADFSSIQAAISSVQARDTLIVHPGVYSAFVLDKRLQIFGLIGPVRPRVMGRSTVDGADAFTIAGLRVDSLDVTGIAGRGSIEDCELVGTPLTQLGSGATLRVTACEELIVARTTVRGHDAAGNVTPGLEVDASTVVVVSCSVRGGHGLTPGPGSCGFSGAVGAVIVNGSRLVATQATIRGGDGSAQTTFSQCGGNGGDGLLIVDSYVELRDCFVVPGVADFDYLGPPAVPVHAIGGTVVSPAIAGTFVSGAVQLVPSYALPTVSVATLVAPGGSGGLSLTGPAGEPGLLVVALDADTAALGHYEGLLWVLPQPILVLPFVTPQLFHFTIPSIPALSGTTLTLQAIYPGLPGVLDPADVMTSNPDQLVIRY